MKSTFSLEFREAFVTFVEEENISLREAAKKKGISKSQAHRWWQLYQHGGKEALNTKFHNYTSEFRVRAVEYTYKNNYSIHESAQILGISDTSLYKWIRNYEKLGAEGLVDMRKFNSGHPKDSLKNTKDLSNSKKKDLLNEIEQLRAEVDYLKKYNTLVQEKNQQTKK